MQAALALGVLSHGTVATDAVYQVAKVGADTNDGSAAHPFLTISACAQFAQAGDTREVHAGIYRETVTPPRSGTANQPLRFVVADRECVTVSGTKPLASTFTSTGGNVWTATVADDIAQMFSNGQHRGPVEGLARLLFSTAAKRGAFKGDADPEATRHRASPSVANAFMLLLFLGRDRCFRGSVALFVVRLLDPAIRVTVVMLGRREGGGQGDCGQHREAGEARSPAGPHRKPSFFLRNAAT